MEQGVIQSPQEIFWKKKKSMTNLADWNEGSVLLSKLSLLKGSTVKAFCCRKCEKVIIDFKDNNCDMNKR
jgi:hypothetical protein